MTLDKVTLDDGGVAGLDFIRDTRSALDCSHITAFHDARREAGLLEMSDPRLAAAAGWAEMDLDLLSARRESRQQKGEKKDRRGLHYSLQITVNFHVEAG